MLEDTKMSMNMSLYHEAENINSRLNRMNETELQSDHAHKLMNRLDEIRRIERASGPLTYKVPS